MDERIYNCCATAAFGMEGLVAGELRELGMRSVSAENGLARFEATLPEIRRCNMSLRFCDRVMIMMAEGKCLSFEDLFQLVLSVPWERFLSGNEAINLSARCARSRIMSPRDCQSISKKAIIERIKAHTSLKSFPENGAPFPVTVSIHSDLARIMLNTSGDTLSRRGYRTWNGEAPLKETLAAALVHLSPWKPGMPLYDPCCGTGTILIEAALIASNRLPGAERSFAMDNFSFCRSSASAVSTDLLKAETKHGRITDIGGSDIDPSAIELAKRHVKQAGLSGKISLSVLPLQDLRIDQSDGVFICNPPYGERLGEQADARRLYRDLHALQDRHPGWSLCAISSDPAFEKTFGKKADRKRRLYNGRLECTYYVYYGRGLPESL